MPSATCRTVILGAEETRKSCPSTPFYLIKPRNAEVPAGVPGLETLWGGFAATRPATPATAIWLRALPIILAWSRRLDQLGSCEDLSVLLRILGLVIAPMIVRADTLCRQLFDFLEGTNASSSEAAPWGRCCPMRFS
jgi:hypothetical protein